jgi:hypothetical protein
MTLQTLTQDLIYALAALGGLSVAATALGHMLPGKVGSVFLAIGVDLGQVVTVLKSAEEADK